MSVEDIILSQVAGIQITGFFVTTEFSSIGDNLPTSIEKFLNEKHKAILQGARGRKFVYLEGEWRLIFTFFPTNSVVDERYALKNKVVWRRARLKTE